MSLIRPPVLASVLKCAASDYHADAVHFDGSTSLSCASLTASGDDTGFVSFSLWFTGDTWSSGNTLFVNDPENFYTNQLDTEILSTVHRIRPLFTNANADPGTFANSNTITSGWHNLLVSAQTNLGNGAKVFQLYLDDVSAINSITDLASAFIMTYNGLSFWVGDDGSGDAYTGDMADFWHAPGTFVDFSVEANRRKFISATGKPVDPSGFPSGGAILFSGGALTFATNQGTGGSFSTAGALTNASTSPSD